MFKNLKRKIGSVMVATVVATFLMSSNAYAYKGIDVSMHNGYIDYNQAKADGVQAVIIKATEGVSYRDNRLEQHYNGARSNSIQHIGFYHFFSESSDPSQQARDFWNAIKDKQYDIMPCLDVETNSWERSSYDLTNRCLEFVQTFEAISGQKVMVYSGAYFSRDELDSRIKSLPLWVASYGRSPIATGFANVVGWQFTESGEIGGVNGNCDVNDFNDGMLLSNSGYVVGSSFSASVDDNSSNPVEQAREFVGSRALELQQKLNRAFNFGLAEDGIIGSASYKAIIDAQGRLSVSQDGLFGNMSWNALENYLGGQSSNNYSNSSDTKVLELQRIINDTFNANILEDNIWGSQTDYWTHKLLAGIPYCTPELTTWIQARLGIDQDGIYYTATAKAVGYYQSKNNLVCDKLAGYRTIKSLCGR